MQLSLSLYLIVFFYYYLVLSCTFKIYSMTLNNGNNINNNYFYYGILEIIWNVIDLNLRIENCTTLKWV